MNKDRIIALTDGIVAIAATIMVLELKIPKIITLDSLLSQIPILYSYIISFALIYLSWRSHHNAFEKAEIINSKIFILNGIWLFFITLFDWTCPSRNIIFCNIFDCFDFMDINFPNIRY